MTKKKNKGKGILRDSKQNKFYTKQEREFILTVLHTRIKMLDAAITLRSAQSANLVAQRELAKRQMENFNE